MFRVAHSLWRPLSSSCAASRLPLIPSPFRYRIQFHADTGQIPRECVRKSWMGGFEVAGLRIVAEEEKAIIQMDENDFENDDF